MRVVVTTEYRFHRLADGRTFTNSAFPYSFWQRYLEVFDEVRVVARAEPVEGVLPSFQRVDGPQVTVVAVPYYVGPAHFLRVRRAVARCVVSAVEPEDAVIVRLPSILANGLEPVLVATGRPFGAEVVGDPDQTFASGGVRHPLRPFFRWWFTRALRRQCRSACAVGYVTQSVLQRAYPPSPSAFSTHYSSVELPDSAIVTKPPPLSVGEKRRRRLLLIGSLEQLYKGPDVLIQALRLATAKVDLELRIVGDGKHRGELEELARRLGVSDRVTFLGQIPGGSAVRSELDAADLFVLPSRTEGLPRALVEAMARGLPAIGSEAGGIAELLPARARVPIGDAPALARRIVDVLTNPSLRDELAAENLAKAREYREETLRARRVDLYAHVKAATVAWISRRPAKGTEEQDQLGAEGAFRSRS
jgi:glycosyltransferase involved in cell wall biosynthesis